MRSLNGLTRARTRSSGNGCSSRAVAGKVAAFRLFGVELSADDLAAFWELVDQFATVAGRLPAHSCGAAGGVVLCGA